MDKDLLARRKMIQSSNGKVTVSPADYGDDIALRIVRKK
jgi:hypothetical protein